MSRDDVQKRLRHRIAAHQAALRLAAELGQPDELADAVHDTVVRADEAEAILEIVEEEEP